MNKFLFGVAATFTFGFQAASASELKILVGPHIGDGTIIELSGVNSDKASVLFRRELDDVVETCVREIGDDSVRAARCIVEQQKKERGKTSRRRAMCSRLTVYTEFGNYSMVNWQVQGANAVRTDWKNHKTEQIVGNCSACNTPQLLDTLRVLCPSQYRDTFGQRKPS